MFRRYQAAREKAKAARADAPPAPTAIQPPVSHRDHIVALGDLRKEYEAKLAEARASGGGSALKEAEEQVEALTARVAELESELQEAMSLLGEQKPAGADSGSDDQGSADDADKSEAKPAGRSKKKTTKKS